MLSKFRIQGIVLVVLLSLTLTGCFGIGGSNPEFEVTGVENGKTYEEPVTPVIKPGKGTTLTITLNDEPFESGTVIVDDGEYELVVVGSTNKDSKTETIKFTVDVQVPIITVTGVEAGVKYWAAVTPIITTNSEGDTVTATLNDVAYTSGTAISDLGAYTLKVTAINAKERTSEVSIAFEIGNPVHNFNINDSATGFTADKVAAPTINTDPQYIKSGDKSLKFETGINTSSAVRINRTVHPDWIQDWSDYDSMGCWFYVAEEDMSKLREDAVEFTIQGPTITKRAHKFMLADLKAGWNFLNVNLVELMGDEAGLRNDMGNKNRDYLIDYIVRTPTEIITVYFDDFFLYNSAGYTPVQ